MNYSQLPAIINTNIIGVIISGLILLINRSELVIVIFMTAVYVHDILSVGNSLQS